MFNTSNKFKILNLAPPPKITANYPEVNSFVPIATVCLQSHDFQINPSNMGTKLDVISLQTSSYVITDSNYELC